ncbi:MAG: acetyltransferase [Phycisphaerales bacterium]
MHAEDTITLIGGGGHALAVANAADNSGIVVRGVYDDASTPTVSRIEVTRLGALRDFTFDHEWILCIGAIAARREFLDRASGNARSIIHPHASVSDYATIGAGTFVAPGAVVHTLARVGAHCIINTGAVVEHECELDDNVHIAPTAALAGNVKVGRDTMIGMGAKILPGVKIGQRVTVGAGAVVIRDVPDGATVVGVPSRFV